MSVASEDQPVFFEFPITKEEHTAMTTLRDYPDEPLHLDFKSRHTTENCEVNEEKGNLIIDI